MPQGQRPSAEQVLGIAPQRPTAEEVLGLPPQRPTAEQVLGLAPQQPQEGWLDRFRRNVGIGYEQGKAALRGAYDTASEATSQALRGNFTPALEALELGARGGLGLQAAVLTGGNPLVFRSVSQTQAAPIARLEAERQARRLAGPDATYYQGVANERARLEAEANRDPSLFGKITRGAVSGGVQALPTIAVGAVTGGSPAAIAATSALSALDQPENVPLAGALAVLPVPAVGPALKGAVSRILGRGAEQIIEAEGAGVAQGAQQVLPGFESAIAEAAGQVPQSMTRRIFGEGLEAYRLIRAAKTSGDISAPLRQAALITLSPSQWVNGNVPRAAVRMFKAFSSKDYQAIQRAIGEDVDGQLAQRMGLELTTQATETGLRRTEEAFLSKWADRIPVIKQSEQAYKTYLDSIRLDRFKGYKAAIDKAGLSNEQTQRAYRAAADWINTATGRGSFGQTIDKTLPVLGEVLFAPRNMASRLQILNPWTYAKNAGTVEGRVVLKEQMKDLLQFAGVVAGTMQMAKLAGGEVNTDYNSPDFLKIKFGNFRYDVLAGAQQVMRLVARVGADLNRAVHNEPPVKRDETALGIAGHFLRSKLAPVPGAFTDFIQRRTYTGAPFSASKELVELYAPLQWADFLDAYQAEGFKGVLKSSPGILGVGVQQYQAKPGGFIEKAQPVLSEYQRAGRGIPEIHRLKDEADDAFKARTQVFGEAVTKYGVDLVNSEDYKRASDAEKHKALDLLPRRISNSLLKSNESWQLAPRVIMSDVRENMQQRR